MLKNLVIEPLCPELADDYFDFFDNRAFSDNAKWSCCYCTYFHMNADSEREVSAEIKDDGGSDALHHALRNRAKKFIAEGTLCGYLAYACGIPIGFCNANNKSAYVRHINEVYSENSGREKSVACFVIAPEYRGQGVATALLARLISDAISEGYSAIEGYPKLNEVGNTENFSGPVRLYKKAGFVEATKMDDRVIMRKTLGHTIENDIVAALVGEEQASALNFVAYLREKGVEFECGQGYWADKRYWMAKCKDEYVCFILFNGYGAVRHKDEPEGWLVWLNGSGFSNLAKSIADECVKKTAWKHIDICGNCGGCGNPGGSPKMLFGKEFDNVCITPLRFDNPDVEAVECLKKLITMRIEN